MRIESRQSVRLFRLCTGAIIFRQDSGDDTMEDDRPRSVIKTTERNTKNDHMGVARGILLPCLSVSEMHWAHISLTRLEACVYSAHV